MLYNSLSMNIRFSRIPGLSFRIFLRFCSTSRTRDPYDVLGLKSTCSTKDVKMAYIKLCKELHPDKKPGDISQHKKFIELNDAYITLLNSNRAKNTNKRAYSNHDAFWKSSNYGGNNSQANWYSEKAWYEKKEYQEYYRERNRKNVMSNHPRISNLWVIIGCFALMIFGSSLYLSAYRYATKYTLQKVDEKSKRLSMSYYDVRKNAANKEKIQQLNNFKKKRDE